MRRPVALVVILVGSASTMSLSGRAQSPVETSVTVNDCYLHVLEQAEIPARDRGVLKSLLVKEGASVKEGEVLAALDDTEARIGVELAKLELLVAVKRTDDSADVQIATATLGEARHLLDQARVNSRIAQQQADTDTAVRQAVKARDVAQADLDRAIAARKEFAPAVSDAELEKLTLMRDSGMLQVEKAQEERSIAAIRTEVEEATIGQRQSSVKRIEFELQQAQTDKNVSDLSVAIKRATLQLAEQQLRNRQIIAPLAGVIVDQQRYAGEWVEPGETVFRIVRLDRLLVEGHVDASLLDQTAQGRRVEVSAIAGDGTTTVQGRVTFVSPEIDPVNQQVQVKAEVDNSQLRFRPGQSVVMEIPSD